MTLKLVSNDPLPSESPLIVSEFEEKLPRVAILLVVLITYMSPELGRRAPLVPMVPVMAFTVSTFISKEMVGDLVPITPLAKRVNAPVEVLLEITRVPDRAVKLKPG